MQRTPAERAVLQLWTDGNSTADIANRLGIRQSAVEAVLMSVLDSMAAVVRQNMSGITEAVPPTDNVDGTI
jgi:DNA-binding CsgD family transcriptional regulator